jgi:hypothetical protein
MSGVLIDGATHRELDHEWFHETGYLDRGLARVSQEERSAARDYVVRNLREAIAKRLPFNVTWTSPGADWTGTPLEPLYSKTGEDEEHAAKLYGLFACRVVLEWAREHGERWWTFKQPIGLCRHTSRSYVRQAAGREEDGNTSDC